MNEKLFIIEQQGNDLLSRRNELISKCRYQNKFKVMNHTTWPLCRNCQCSDNFLMKILSRIWTEYEEYPRIHLECGVIRIRTNPNADTFHPIDIRTLLRYFNTTVLYICSYMLAEWLWRHGTSSSASRCFCFVSLIPEYKCVSEIFKKFIDIRIIKIQHLFRRGRGYSSNPMILIIIKHQLFLTNTDHI